MYKYYLAACTKKYIIIETLLDGITLWRAFGKDDKPIRIAPQVEKTDLDPMDWLNIGQLLEIHRSVKNKQRDYDPFVIWSQWDKERYLP